MVDFNDPEVMRKMVEDAKKNGGGGGFQGFGGMGSMGGMGGFGCRLGQDGEGWLGPLWPAGWEHYLDSLRPGG